MALPVALTNHTIQLHVYTCTQLLMKISPCGQLAQSQPIVQLPHAYNSNIYTYLYS